ncbi:MAG: ROK family protein [Eubacteriales bacterium]|nr:ROK family protein [Eubacteriales bacterium]
MGKAHIIAGIDIGGTSVKIGLFDEQKKMVCNSEIPTRKALGFESVVNDIYKGIDNLLMDLNQTSYELNAIGVGVPGIVNGEGIVNHGANLGADRIELYKLLKDRFGDCSIKIANDANTAALGEVAYGAAKGFENVIMVTVGTGIGAGIIINGKIYAGKMGLAGEIGHMIVNDNENSPCGCGRFGCLEQYASATGITRLAKKMFNETVTTKEIFQLSERGNELAQNVLAISADYLGKALANAATAIEPEAFIIGGGVANAGESYRRKVERAYKKYALLQTKHIPILLAELGNKAGMYGAMEMSAEEDRDDRKQNDIAI